ncbi:MAG TPA: AAA family ATPase, partial [Burkholderiaceae bacterium]
VDYPKERGGDATVTDYVAPLNQFLLDAHAQGRNNVLIIDEAQNLSAEVIEQLRLLTNLETSERKLLQIVLIGQPELRTMLARPDMEQLAQRVIARFHLPALSETETAHYVAHRLAVAGRVAEAPFDRAALQRIHKLSRGVPRRINLLCDRALLGAYATGKASVGRAIVDKAAHEVFDDEYLPPPATKATPAPRPAAATGDGQPATRMQRLGALPPLMLVAAGLAGGLLLFGLLSLGLRGSNPAPAAAPAPAAPTASTPAASEAAPTAPPAAVGNTPGSTGAAPSFGTTSPPAAAPPATLPTAAASLAKPGATETAPAVLKAFHRTDNDAWRELASLWKLQVGPGDACAQVERQQVECFEQPKSTLTTVQQLDRPGILALYDGSKKPVYVLLNGMGPNTATLVANGTSQTVSLNTLLQLWRGEYFTLWRAPAEYRGKVRLGASGPPVDWLGSRLALLQGGSQPPEGKRFDPVLKSQVTAFQLANNIKADGVAGPETFMQLNRAIGVNEPRLIPEK